MNVKLGIKYLKINHYYIIMSNTNKIIKNIKYSKKFSPVDDFYNYVNNDWCVKTKIPADRSRWGITEEFHYIYETWKELVAKHGYNPYRGRDSVTHKQNKDTVIKEVELNKIKKILGQ